MTRIRAFLNTSPRVGGLRRFYASRWYIGLIVLLSLVSYATGGERVVWSIFVFFAAVAMLVCPDLLPVVPPTFAAVFCLSVRHAPMRPTYSGYLFTGRGLAVIVVLGSIVVLSFIAHCILFGVRLPENTGKPALAPFLLPLTAVLLLNGLGQGGYSPKNLVFGAITAFCWCGLYFVYALQLPHGERTKEYIFDGCFAIAWLLLFELGYVYMTNGVVKNGAVDVSKIVMGWGIHNGIGIMLALLIPLMLRMAAKRRRAPLYYLTAVALLVGIFLTTSRGSLLVGTGAFLTGSVILCFMGENRRVNRLMFALTLVLVAVALLGFREQIFTFLPRFRTDGLNDNGRFDLWREGWHLFLGAPVFGAGFSAISFKSWAGGLFPGYLHNTVFELLGAGGAAALAAYLAYRVRSVMLFVKKPTFDRTFMGLSIAVLLGGSLLDNHVFNIYPMFFYAALLVLSEADLLAVTSADVPVKPETA